MVMRECALVDADSGRNGVSVGGVGRLLHGERHGADWADVGLFADGDAAVFDRLGGSGEGGFGTELGFEGDAKDGAGDGIDGEGAVIGRGFIERLEVSGLSGVVGLGAAAANVIRADGLATGELSVNDAAVVDLIV